MALTNTLTSSIFGASSDKKKNDKKTKGSTNNVLFDSSLILPDRPNKTNFTVPVPSTKKKIDKKHELDLIAKSKITPGGKKKSEIGCCSGCS